MQVILNAGQVSAAISKLNDLIAEDTPADIDIVVIGIKSRGEVIARRLCRQLSESLGKSIDCGAVDITLYRDDINDPQGTGQMTFRGTDIDFDIDDKIVILVDDVLYTGRSARAAMDALIDLGRPRAIRLAVLIDRGHREYPIQADYVSSRIDVAENESVEVNMVETDDIDQVVVK